jgi:D-serine deaminase-like pyridoxal phosphate-dependent protein
MLAKQNPMWYRPNNESIMATPCILLYPDRIEENIRRMIAMAGGAERLRPHVKTHKIAEVVKLQLQQGISKFKCATLSEVEMVAEAGGRDILLAYPLLGPGIPQWFDLMERFPSSRLAVTVDSERAVQEISEGARRQGVHVDLFVDIDNGMHRTGITPAEAAALIASILNKAKLRFRGLHIYDGHIHEVDALEREMHCAKDFEAVIHLVNELKKGGTEVEELACGGTPTFPIHAADPSRTLCPGTPLLWDAGYAGKLPDLDFLPAAVLAGRVISRPGNQLCLDLGYKAFASEMAHPRLSFMELKVKEVLNHSEEHLVLSGREVQHLSVGDLVYALPIHICPTMALHEQVYVVRDQEITETWQVEARKRTYPL